MKSFYIDDPILLDQQISLKDEYKSKNPTSISQGEFPQEAKLVIEAQQKYIKKLEKMCFKVDGDSDYL